MRKFDLFKIYFVLFFSLLFYDSSLAINVNIKSLTSGPIVMGIPDNQLEDGHQGIHLWGRAHHLSSKFTRFSNFVQGHPAPQNEYIVARLKRDGEDEYGDPVYKPVDQVNDYVDVIPFKNLAQGTQYDYQIGCFALLNDDLASIESLDWTNAHTGSFRTNDPTAQNFSFMFGSCRRFVKVGPATLFASGKGADHIFQPILLQLAGDEQHQPIDFFLRVGDNVYFDPLGKFWCEAKSLKAMRKRYKVVQAFPYLQQAMSSLRIYNIPDDHDTAFNNVNYESRTEHPNTFAHGAKTFREYQYWDGPAAVSPNLWYVFSNGIADFFVMDTRTKRDERTIDEHGVPQEPFIIDPEQFDAFRTWIQDPAKRNRIKFVVSPSPMISQDDADGWGGFPVQQKAVIKLMLGNDTGDHPIRNVFILTGDNHSANSTTMDFFEIENEVETPLGQLTELMSSGLKAINYGTINDFPDEIDSSAKGGLKMVKNHRSPIFPDSTATEGIGGKIASVFHANVDSVISRIDIKFNEGDPFLAFLIFNQDNQQLYRKDFTLATADE